jgi:glycerol-3-phosphate dehydrogenase (NAD(P)+)
MTSERGTIVVIGAGAFGTALAAVIANENRHDVTLLGRDVAVMRDLSQNRTHESALPGIMLPDSLKFSSDASVLANANIVLFVMPSQAQAAAAKDYAPYLNSEALIVTCAKGIDRNSGKLLSEVLETALPNRQILVLSGPGFAADIANGLPTAMSLAAGNIAAAEHVAQSLSGSSFRLYASDDRIGVQLGGALKNVLAIACGIVEGAGLGESARAALIARGLAEMSRLAVALGAQSGTIGGLSGLGDLVLTATSHQSRNLRFGFGLGRGEPVADGKLVEGALAASVAAKLAAEKSIEMPITEAVAAIIEGRLDIRTAIHDLMTRPITTERD